jgi:transcriptional regulator with XRE-family HTH domain
MDEPGRVPIAPAPERRTCVRAKDIGATVRAVRTERDMTRADLARKVGVPQSQISRLENGLQGFRSDALARIARALDVPSFRPLMTDVEWRWWLRRT